MSDQQSTALAASNTTAVAMGFGSLAGFEFLQRTAKAFTLSTMVPTAYQANISEGYGRNKKMVPNPAAMSNCMIALDMAARMNANPLMIMQNLHVIEGRPSWSSTFIISMINQSGRFSPLRFELEWLKEIDATYSTYEWFDGNKQEKKHQVRVRDARCIAWAVEKGTPIPQFPLEELKAHGGVYGCCKLYGIPILESAPITMAMAVTEGWYGKSGSKWQSMPDQMLRYRSAAFFGRVYAPELLMGLPTEEEIHDVFVQAPDGSMVNAGPQGVPTSTGTLDPSTGTVQQDAATYDQADFDKGLPGWVKMVVGGKKTMESLIATLETKAPLSGAQRSALEVAIATSMPQDVPVKEAKPEAQQAQAEQGAPQVTLQQVLDRINAASDEDSLNEAANLIDALEPAEIVQANAAYDARMGVLGEQS